MYLPVLGKVPRQDEELLIKAGNTGITLLKQRRYFSRYTGNKFSAVDINGKLWLRASELKKDIASWSSDKGNKKRVRRPQATPGKEELQMQDTDNISTDISTIAATTEKLSTKRTYSVNKKEVRHRIISYINTQRGSKELYFWTVTFPAGTDDAMCYRIFNIWLTSLRKYKMLKEYLWIAERQPLKTKTIHFHIAIPHKMNVHKANAMMAGTLRTFARRKEIPFTEHQCKRYNGVDISKNRKTKRVVNFAVKKGARALANYLTKYATKNDEKFEHLAWHNSRGYSALFTGVTFTVAEFIKHGFAPYLNRTRIFESEFAKFIPWLYGPPKIITDHLFLLNSYLQEILN